jgi:hypothetical protein
MDPEEMQEQPLGAGLNAAEGAETSREPQPFSGGPPEGFVARDEYDRAMSELEEERARTRESQAFIHDANQRLNLESTVRRELERMYQEHTTQQERWSQMQPPAPQSLEEWLVEPQQIADYVNRYGQWVRQTTMAQLHPFLQRLSLYDGVLPIVLSRAAEDSMKAAKKQLEDEGIEDFDELRPEIEQAFAQNPAGPRLLLDPSTITSVYHFLARQKGVRPVRDKSKPVPTAGTSRPGPARGSNPAVTSAVRSVAERLQINPAKLAERLAKRTTS